MTFRSDKKQSREVFLYDPIGGDDGEGNTMNLLDVLETEEEDIPERMEREEKIASLYGFIEENLTDREKHIIRLRYGIGIAPEKTEQEITQREIAKQLGISRSYVSRIEKKALQKLRRAYENEKNNLGRRNVGSESGKSAGIVH
jgi:RNA polymerase sporulation-specific sigma factor